MTWRCSTIINNIEEILKKPIMYELRRGYKVTIIPVSLNSNDDVCNFID